MRILLPCGASANVSPNVSPETVNTLDAMMRAVKKQFARENMEPNPDPKPCGDPTCRHSRTKHKHKTQEGMKPHWHYGPCRMRGCRCPSYQEPRNQIYAPQA